MRLKRSITFAALFALLVSGIAVLLPKAAAEAAKDATANAGNSGVYFEENRGQFHEKVSYLARGTSGHTLFLTPRDAVYVVTEDRSRKSEDRRQKDEIRNSRFDIRDSKGNGMILPAGDLMAESETRMPRRAVAVYMSLVGGNEFAASEGIAQLEHRTNYFKGSQENWRTEIPNYSQVRFDGVYPGVDIVWRGNAAGNAVAGLTLEPFADVSQIEWEIAGADDVRVTDGGDLLIKTEFGDILQPAPQAFQRGDGFRAEVDIAYDVSQTEAGRFRVGYRVGEFDRGRAFEIGSAPKETPPTSELTTLGFSTYVGAGNDEDGVEVFVDSSNNVFVAGSTSSTSSSDPFPTVPGSYDTSGNGGWDGFIFKMNSTGSGLIYSTFIGGGGTEFLTDMKVDAAGNVYVTGRTDSGDFPFVAGFDPTYNGGTWDGFVAKLDPAGSALVFSSYLGGSSDDRAWGIAIDGSNNVYVSGHTFSSNFPVTGTAFDMTANGSWDAFLTKVNSSGATLDYSTYFGGSGGEDGNVKVAVDSAGNAYIAGSCTSDAPSFPVTAGVIQPARAGSYDLYVAKIDTNVSGPAGLIYSTFLGGTGFDNTGNGKIRVNAAGEAHLTGYTESSNFPTNAGAYDTSHNGGEDAVVIKLNSTATGLLYSTFLGSSGNERSSGLFITPTGEVFVTGSTTSPAFPVTAGAYDTTHGGSGDVFVAKVDVTGTLTGSASLMYSTFLGAGSDEAGFGIFSTAADVAYVTGYTRGPAFPTTLGAFDLTHNGVNDVFVTKLAPPPPTAAQVSIGGRVFDDNGFGVRNATVTLVQADGTTLTTQTSSFGYYIFEGVEVGQTAVLAVRLRTRRYAPVMITVSEDLTGINFYPSQ